MRMDLVLRQASATKAASPKLAELKQSADGLEATFAKSMLAAMRRANPESHLGQSLGGDMFRDMFDEKLVESVSGKFGLGLSRAVMRQLGPELVRQEMVRQSGGTPSDVRVPKAPPTTTMTGEGN